MEIGYIVPTSANQCQPMFVRSSVSIAVSVHVESTLAFYWVRASECCNLRSMVATLLLLDAFGTILSLMMNLK